MLAISTLLRETQTKEVFSKNLGIRPTHKIHIVFQYHQLSTRKIVETRCYLQYQPKRIKF